MTRVPAFISEIYPSIEYHRRRLIPEHHPRPAMSWPIRANLGPHRPKRLPTTWTRLWPPDRPIPEDGKVIYCLHYTCISTQFKVSDLPVCQEAVPDYTFWTLEVVSVPRLPGEASPCRAWATSFWVSSMGRSICPTGTVK